MAEDDEVVDETVLLTRRARRGQAAETPGTASDHAGDGEPEEPDGIDAPVEDRTVVIDRGTVEDRTVAMKRPTPDDRTLVVDRAARKGGERAASDIDPSTMDTVKAAAPRGDVGEPSQAIYKPRAVPLVPSRPPALTAGADATRDAAAVTASIVRRSRRGSVLAVAAVVAAGAASLAGLVTLGLLLLS